MKKRLDSQKSRRMSLMDRFNYYTDKSGPGECWTWVGPEAWVSMPTPYGRLCVNGKRIHAHVISFRLHNGTIPKGLIIRHTCHNTRCVNPGHLITGTKKDNIHDCLRADRYPVGTRNSLHKLTEEKVREVLETYTKTRKTAWWISGALGINVSTVNNIIRGVGWKHISKDYGIKPVYRS